MSDIKFSCPQCGQHISASQIWASRQIPCPKCQAVLTVPGHSPAAASSIPPVLPFAPPLLNSPSLVTTTPRPAKGASPWIWIILGVGMVGVAVVALLGFLAFNYFKTQQPRVTTLREEAPAPPTVVKIKPPKAEDPAVITVLASMIIPDRPVSGTLRDQLFAVETAVISPSSVLLRQGEGLIPDASLRFFLFLKPDEPLDGRKFIIEPGVKVRIRPHIHVSRKEGPNGGLKTEIISSNYSLRVEFGEQQGNKLPDRIYLEMADRLGTKVAGASEVTVGP